MLKKLHTQKIHDFENISFDSIGILHIWF